MRIPRALRYFAASHLSPLLGVKSLGFVIQSIFKSPNPDFVSLGVLWLQAICVQYACLLLPAFAIGWWRRRKGPAQYGITKAGHSFLYLILLGLVAFALVGLPQQVFWMATERPMLNLLDRSWTPAFWLFLAIASFGLNQTFEELFFRGYCQTRLEENFGGVGAILIVSLFVTLGHNQYHHLNLLSIGQMVGLLLIAVGMGYVFWRTRSIVPAIVLHGVANFPTIGIYALILPAAMVIALIWFRQSWWEEAQRFCRGLAGKGWKGQALVGAIFAIAMTIGFEVAPRVIVPLAAVGLVVAVIVEFRDRQRLTG